MLQYICFVLTICRAGDDVKQQPHMTTLLCWSAASAASCQDDPPQLRSGDLKDHSYMSASGHCDMFLVHLSCCWVSLACESVLPCNPHDMKQGLINIQARTQMRQLRAIMTVHLSIIQEGRSAAEQSPVSNV